MQTRQLNVSSETLRTWLENRQEVFILDVRPKEQREEWYIPGSIHLDAYSRLDEGDASVLNEVQIPNNVPVVTVCVAGRTSTIAANELRKKGIEAYSLEGGMKGWSTAWNTATLFLDKYEVVQFRRTGKGCLSYMIISENESAIIDASLPTEAYIKVLSERELKLRFVLDTHIHADHLSRSKELADKFNVPIYLPNQEKIAFKFEPLSHGDKLTLDSITIRVLHTPGHTFESSTYVLDDKLAFTGDTLFIDGIGGPDLKSSKEESVQKAKLLYQSLQTLSRLHDTTVVLPGHTSKPVEFNDITVQALLSSIKQRVTMLHLSQDDFVKTLLERIPATPPNYLAITEANITGRYEGIIAADLEVGANRCSIQ